MNIFIIIIIIVHLLLLAWFVYFDKSGQKKSVINKVAKFVYRGGMLSTESATNLVQALLSMLFLVVIASLFYFIFAIT